MQPVSDMAQPKIAGWITGVLLLVMIGRLGWLAQTGELAFQSEITALLPVSEDSPLVNDIDDRVSATIRNRIVVVIQGTDQAQTDTATDYLSGLFDQGIARKQISGKWVDEAGFNLLSARIKAMLEYKDRLIGDRSRRRMQDSVDAQLIWRMDQTTRFPPSNITDPVADPLGTIEEFLAERLPGLRGVKSDGLYLRVDSDIPANLLLIDLAEGDLGNEQASGSIRWVFNARDAAAGEFNVKIYLAGIPLHAAAIKEQTSNEIRWMAALSAILTLVIFLYITRSIRALLVSAASIVLAIAGGLVISHGIVGLPHLIGLIMATTAIGICIDVSFHFWIHVRAGMSGATAIRTIRPGVHMCFLTTIIGLLVIASTSVPVLVRTAVFVCGALLVSWLLALFIVPRLAGGTDKAKPLRMLCCKLPRKFAAGLMLVIAGTSAFGLTFKYYTDDNPARLGRPAASLLQDDLVVRNLLDITGEPGIYLMRANSANSLIEAETALLGSLTDEDLSQVEAVSRLVVPETQQRRNQLLFRRAKDALDAALLEQYLSALRVPDLDWQSDADGRYSLQWVTSQPWASIERDRILVCEDTVCASMIRAQGEAVGKLDVSCQRSPECSRISFSERRISAFREIRISLIWALLLAIGAIFFVLYFRYRGKAFKLITVPILASVGGTAVVVWAGMPVTVFTLAAVFLLLGLSVDYVVFASESNDSSSPTFSAILASALTTSLSFSILSFSNTPAVQFFALPVAVGIPIAWVSVQAMLSDHV